MLNYAPEDSWHHIKYSHLRISVDVIFVSAMLLWLECVDVLKTSFDLHTLRYWRCSYIHHLHACVADFFFIWLLLKWSWIFHSLCSEYTLKRDNGGFLRAVYPSWQWFWQVTENIKRTAAGSGCEDLRDSFTGQKHSAVDVCVDGRDPRKPPHSLFSL